MVRKPHACVSFFARPIFPCLLLLWPVSQSISVGCRRAETSSMFYFVIWLLVQTNEDAIVRF